MGSNRQQAELLADQRFLTFMTWDVTEANRPVYKVGNVELPDCVVQSDTLEEALQKLDKLRVATIEYMLDTGLPVPYSHEMDAVPAPPVSRPRASDPTHQLEHVLV